MHYDWAAALVFVGVQIGLNVGGRFLAFRIPALERMRVLNREADRTKLSRPRYAQAVKINNRGGLITNLVFAVTILPFCVNLEPRPLWRHAVDIIAVLLTYDFAYYLTHRFVFHGKILRRVHALHHQARTPTYIDALYVHPLETVIGLGLFLGSIPLIAWLGGAPLGALSIAVAMLTFTQLNTLNHSFVYMPYFPFKTLSHITAIHAAHHVDMNQGNYATLSTLYDRLFGTYETPVSRAAP